jgi:hypothetical protein
MICCLSDRSHIAMDVIQIINKQLCAVHNFYGEIASFSLRLSQLEDAFQNSRQNNVCHN